jgi:hypothetical protein
MIEPPELAVLERKVSSQTLRVARPVNSFFASSTAISARSDCEVFRVRYVALQVNDEGARAEIGIREHAVLPHTLTGIYRHDA